MTKTARSVNLHVLVYTYYTERHRTKVHRHGSASKTHSAVADRSRGETQQELILFKHKEWSVVYLVLSDLTVTVMGMWR